VVDGPLVKLYYNLKNTTTLTMTQIDHKKKIVVYPNFRNVTLTYNIIVI